MNITVKKIAKLIKGTIEGDPTLSINCVSTIDKSIKDSISFLVNPKYENFIYTTKASCVIVNKDFLPIKKIRTTIIRVENPYTQFANVINIFNGNGKKHGIDSSAKIKDNTRLGKDVYIGEMSYIGDNVTIGDDTQIYPQCFIGDNVKIGSNTILFPGVKVYHSCEIHNNCTIHSGVIIGSDGFGFALDKKRYSKIQQIGNVLIKDNVEIGSNSTIDRATIGSTIINRGVKLDNLIQIAHNVEIGRNTVIAAQTGIAGSSKIGNNCMIGGQVAINGHITIADNVKISGKAGVTKSIHKKGAIIQGYWAYDRMQHQRSYIHFKNLPNIVQRINKLEGK